MNINELKRLLTKASLKYLSPEEAKYFVEKQIDNHIKKYPRVNPIKEAIDDIENWSKNKNKKFRVKKDKGASFLIDFNGLAPSLKIKYIHDELYKRAKRFGISFVAIKNSAGIHTLNLWSDSLARKNLLSVCAFNGGPFAVVPYGGTAGIFGTNPISYAVPTKGDPVIADFATSEIPFFEFLEVEKEGKRLKEDVAVDKRGNVTRDPRKAMANKDMINLLPMGGGIKGYLLVYLLEVMTGAMIDSLLSTEMDPAYIPAEQGFYYGS